MKPFLLVLLLSISCTLLAQTHDKAIGLRTGVSSGVFFDMNQDDYSTLRFLLTDRNRGQQLSVMKYYREYKHEKLPSDFSVYYGFGLHGGFIRWDGRKIHTRWGSHYQQYTAPVFGLDGLVGVSYHLHSFPLLLSAEIKPYFDMWGRNIFSINPFDFGFSISYVF